MNNLSKDNFEDDEDDVSGNKASSDVPCVNRDLPILAYKDEIIQLVKNNQIIIIQGQTGCGKTTQIPQYLYNTKSSEQGLIGVTQPRKIAAVSMANRVAKEMKCGIGIEVGYEVRFNKKKSASTKIKYMTDGILLNECVIDRALSEYRIIMIDEVHERSVNTDVLLGLLKIIAKEKSQIKIIISSATINSEKLSSYFNDAKILSIEGRLYPIEVIYTGYCKDYIEKCYQVVQMIQLGNRDGDILIFLTGEEEIEECCSKLEKFDNLVVKPLYAALDFNSQQDVFENVRQGERKVIVATNIAETSITIEGITFVIDCGYVNQNRFVTEMGISFLGPVKISKAQAEQRKGRAGRNGPGVCYRLYSEDMYNDFINESVPEIHRHDLSEIYLKLLEFRIDPKKFDFIDKPSDEELNRSQKELSELSIIDSSGNLTPVGSQLVDVPVDPHIGKVLIVSLNKQCTIDVIKMISMLSEKYIFKRPRKLRNNADKQKEKFNDPDGDHFTLLKVYDEWKKLKSETTSKKQQFKVKEWCYENFIDMNTMETVDNVFRQIYGIMKKKNFPIVDKTANRQSIKQSIISGYFKNICVKQSRDAYMRLYTKTTVHIHPSSCLFKSSPKIILFHDVRKTERAYLHGIMRLDEVILKDFEKEKQIINFPNSLDDSLGFSFS